MMFMFFWAALALCCSVRAQHLNCKELTQPLDPSLIIQISGKWILFAASSNNKNIFNMMQMTKSSWMEITSESETIRKVHTKEKWGDHCFVTEGESTFSDGQIKLRLKGEEFESEHVGHYIQTLDNGAIVWSGEISFIKQKKHKGKTLLLFTKNGTLADSTRERFNSQAACLSFTDFQFYESTGLCPL